MEEALNNSIDEKTTSLVFYHNPYTKIKFVNEITNSYKIPLFYVDFDLLFSGYYESGLIIKKSNITILRPNEVDFVKNPIFLGLKQEEPRHLAEFLIIPLGMTVMGC